MDKQRKKHILHKENCQAKIRRTHIKPNGVCVSLFGRHGFEWGIITESSTHVTITTFPNRQMAVQEYEKSTI